jgi:hypothetical protein
MNAILPRVKEVVSVMAGVIPGLLTVPWNPLAVIIDTLVTVPDPAGPDAGTERSEATEDDPSTVSLGAEVVCFLEDSPWINRNTRFISSTVKSWIR